MGFEMGKIETIKALLASGSDESKELLAKIIPCFNDAGRTPQTVADEIEPLVAALPDAPRTVWTQTIEWLRAA